MMFLKLIPHNTLFFSDSTPFSTGIAAQSEPGGLFPALPLTVVGALRAALARAKGWNGRDSWPSELRPYLGESPNQLSKAVDRHGKKEQPAVHFAGPYVLRGEEVMFPLPRHVVGYVDQGRFLPQAIARPGEPVDCDLGEQVRLPSWPTSPDHVRLGAGKHVWVTTKGMHRILAGRLPNADDIVPQEALWLEERRVGIERRSDTRTAREGMLYSARHIRLQEGVSLGVQINGWPKAWPSLVGSNLTLGGEGKLVTGEAWQGPPALGFTAAEAAQKQLFAAVTLTPLDLNHKRALLHRKLSSLGNVQVISACLDRAVRAGGWDSRDRKPLPNRCLLPAGSVLFCERIGNEPGVVRPNRNARFQIGRRRAVGFGELALGLCIQEEEQR